MVKRKESTEKNLWTELFVSKEMHIVKRFAYNLEVAVYDFYKYTPSKYTVFGIKSSVCEVSELTGKTISPLYNQYVKDAKLLGKEYYGVQLEFLYKNNCQGDEDDL